MDIHVEGVPPPAPVDAINDMVADAIENWICGEDGIVAEAFKVNGYPYPWAQLKHRTELEKARLGYNPWQDQRRTGKLQSDAQHPTIARHPGSVVFIIYPGQNKYAAAHQYGTRYMPPRQPLPCPTESDCAKEAEKLGELLLKARGWL